MLGIDVSKDVLDAALADRGTRRVLWDLHIPNTREGVQALLERTPADVAWVVEPTGRYSLLVVQQGVQAGRTVLMAPTRQAKRYAESHSSRAKTDKTSARSLAWMGLDRPLSPYPLKSPHVEEIDQLLSARRGVAQTITDLTARGRDLPHARQALEPALEGLRAQLVSLDRQLAQALKRSPLADLAGRLRAIPGIGALSATAFASRLQAKQFAQPDRWVAYCGLDVGVRQSGKRQGETGLSRQGDAELRRLAYLCAQAAVRAANSPFRQQFVRERAKGLSKIAAYCAVARKVLRVTWALEHYQSEYDAETVYLSPQQRRERRQEQRAANPTASAS